MFSIRGPAARSTANAIDVQASPTAPASPGDDLVGRRACGARCRSRFPDRRPRRAGTRQEPRRSRVRGRAERHGATRSRIPPRGLRQGGRSHRRTGLHPHELRHTAASLAIASGANVKVVQQMLGHKSATVTLDQYGHLFGDDLDAVADRLDVQARTARKRVTRATDAKGGAVIELPVPADQPTTA